MSSRSGPRCASGALLVAPFVALAVAAIVAATACNSSNPVAPDPPPPTGNSPFTITVTASPSTLSTGATTPATITVAVQAGSGAAPADGTSVAVSTSLGNFGTNSQGTAITLTTLTLSGGRATTSLFAGSTNGTAQVLAQIGQIAGQVAVSIQTAVPVPFFLTAISPNFGSQAGGQVVTITGSGFQTPVRVV